MTRFMYYEIRPCIELAGHVVSFLGEPEYNPAIGDKVCTAEGARKAALEAASGFTPIFWTIYGRKPDGCAVAIGDFTSFEAASEVLGAILRPLREAADEIGRIDRGINPVAAALDDICNQSTNEDRL